jgi:hypothetical protein
MSGLGQLGQVPRGQAGARSSVEPEFLAENLLFPVRLFGCDDNRVAIGRDFYGIEAHRVEEFVEGEFGLGGLSVRKDRNRNDWR